MLRSKHGLVSVIEDMFLTFLNRNNILWILSAANHISCRHQIKLNFAVPSFHFHPFQNITLTRPSYIKTFLEGPVTVWKMFGPKKD